MAFDSAEKEKEQRLKKGSYVCYACRHYSSEHGDYVGTCLTANCSCTEFVHTPSRLDRKGDSQELPTPNDSEDIQSMVIRDIEARRKVGIERYGTALQANNGRDALVDLYEELIDAAMYAKQRIIEEALVRAEFPCQNCDGNGWVIDADPLPSGEPGEPYQAQCDACGGSGHA